MKTRHEVWKEQEAAIAALEADLDRAGKLLTSTDAAAGHGRAVQPTKADTDCRMAPRHAAPTVSGAASSGPFWQWIARWWG